MAIIKRCYSEPTQWAADVELANGQVMQLTFQDYPPTGPAPSTEAILGVAATMESLMQSEWEVVAEDGYVA